MIFDFDYTLADSSKGVRECIDYALKKLGLPTPSDELLFQTIGLSLQDTFEYLTGDTDTERGAKFARLFVDKADEVMADLTHIFETVTRLLTHLKDEDIKLGIVSTKFRYRIESILRRENLSELFSVIIGGEDVLRKKPDPEGLLTAIEMLKVSPLKSVYVGDSTVDAETARRAGVPFIAVLTGVTSREAFGEYSAIGIVEGLDELHIKKPRHVKGKREASVSHSNLRAKKSIHLQ
jgi:phosphoglycolate phosphatase